MDKLPALERLAEPAKDALMAALWAEGQRLQARLAALEGKLHEPRKDAHHASVPPSHTPKANLATGPRTGMRREASVGRAGGGRPLHPTPDQVRMAQAKTCRHWGGTVQAHAPRPHAVYDKMEVPPGTPIVTRVEQSGGPCPHCGESYGAPVPVEMAPGTPCGASIQGLAIDLQYTHAISDERLAALCAQVYGVAISEGALANLCQLGNTRLDHQVEKILTRLRRSRLICRDETGARLHGRTPWAWVFQNADVCVQVIRPRRGHGVIPEVLGDHRPTVWVSALYRAQKHHPAADWQVGLAHQFRDGQFAIEAGDAVFAPRMQAGLLRAFALHKRRDT